jgi:hypothetical protein
LQKKDFFYVCNASLLLQQKYLFTNSTTCRIVSTLCFCVQFNTDGHNWAQMLYCRKGQNENMRIARK